jgi:hypothetical protein
MTANSRRLLSPTVFIAAALIIFIHGSRAQEHATATARATQPARRVAVTFDDLPMTGDAGRSSGEGVLENTKRSSAR